MGPAFVTSHTVSLTSLACNQTFHYRVTSADASSNASSSTDDVFTTGVCPPSIGPQPDEFQGTILDAMWTIYDPVGDGSVSESAGHLQLKVPAGVSHDVWTSGNRSLRVLQAISDVDFEVEIKLDSPVTSDAQMEGILVEQDSSNYLRFDLLRSGGSTRIFAATFAGGAATTRANTTIAVGGGPVWLRLKRLGNAWTGSWSTNGTSFTLGASFTQTYAVARIGPFVGNHGVPVTASPAFTASIDYFHTIAGP